LQLGAFRFVGPLADLNELCGIRAGLLAIAGVVGGPCGTVNAAEAIWLLRHWLAYQSDESGQNQIYVQPFPELEGGRWQVSPAGGREPAWARNGRELFYLDADGALVTVPVQTQPAFSASSPTKLFDAPYSVVSGTRRYDVTVDGQRFLFIKDKSGSSGPPQVVVVQNWSEELRRLVQTN